jgi:acyl-CoA synthetase (AMP-forming)/AMP-acid ligase II
MVKVKGATVYPAEVEAALAALDGVRQAHVTDVPDGPGRRQVAALVVTDRTVESLRRSVRSALSAFKVPSVWFTTPAADDVPTLASGKVDKVALQQLLETKGSTE